VSADHASEAGAAAAAAYVAGAKALRRDLGGGVQMRDFDLRYGDGRADEPLEVTHFADQASIGTWKRLGRADSRALALSRVWTIDIPSSERRPDGSSGPSDVKELLERLESPLRALEERGECEFTVPGPPGDHPLRELADLGCDIGCSRSAEPGESGGIGFVAAVGGVTSGDSVAWAVEQEAAKRDNQAKLRCLPDAPRRHLFVVMHPSSGSAYFAVKARQLGRLPVLPDPITTAWVWNGDSPCLFVTTPPATWEHHQLPSEVLSNPERWITKDVEAGTAS
jgi:hypothetical protein